jgi:plasmid stabilization system protein ParE
VRFTVRWKEDASDDLTAIWLAADSRLRRNITSAAREVDRLLQYDPDRIGESREHDRRITFAAPLAVTFRVDAQARKVEVLRIRQFH